MIPKIFLGNIFVLLNTGVLKLSVPDFILSEFFGQK